MIEYLQNLTSYNWLTFSFLIVILEVLGLGGFMLGFSIASLVVFLTMLIADISWQVQFAIFGVLSIVFSIGWYLYQFKKDKEDEDSTSLNKKENHLIGQRVTLSEDIAVGKGRIALGDSTWAVYTEEDLKKGDAVEIVKVNGIFLNIKKV